MEVVGLDSELLVMQDSEHTSPRSEWGAGIGERINAAPRVARNCPFRTLRTAQLTRNSVTFINTKSLGEVNIFVFVLSIFILRCGSFFF